MAKVNMVREYLEEEVNYGGVRMPRGQMIRELTSTAKATGRKDWRALVNAYLAGQATKVRRNACFISETVQPKACRGETTATKRTRP